MSELTPHQQRRIEERQRRRDEILDAAGQVFAERGFDAATMDDVATLARVSRALVYVYFRDKEALYLGICERALHTLRALFRKAISEHDNGRDQVAAIGRSYIRFADTHPCLFQALSHFEARSTDPGDEDPAIQSIMEVGQSVHAVTVEAITNGMADGTLRQDIDNPLQIAMTLWGFTHGVVQIAQHKQRVIAHHGIALDDFVDGAIALATSALEKRS